MRRSPSISRSLAHTLSDASESVPGGSTDYTKEPASLRANGLRQRAQRRGLSLRRSGRGGNRTINSISYWLVASDVNAVVAGGDVGLSLEEVAAWLTSC